MYQYHMPRQQGKFCPNSYPCNLPEVRTKASPQHHLDWSLHRNGLVMLRSQRPSEHFVESMLRSSKSLIWCGESRRVSYCQRLLPWTFYADLYKCVSDLNLSRQGHSRKISSVFDKLHCVCYIFLYTSVNIVNMQDYLYTYMKQKIVICLYK